MLAHATPRAAQLSLDDMIKKSGPGKGKGGGRGAASGGRGAGAGRGGAIKRGGVARSARQSATPYKKPAKGGGSTLSSMATNSRTNAASKNAALKQSGGLTTGGSAKIKVANLETGVTSGDIKELFGEIGNVKSAEVVTNQAGASKGAQHVQRATRRSQSPPASLSAAPSAREVPLGRRREAVAGAPVLAPRSPMSPPGP